MTETSPNPRTSPSKLRASLLWLLRLLGKIVVTFVLMLIASYFLIQLPVVQTWAAKQVTDYLSEELNTKVSVEGLDIKLFDRLSLEGFYLEDQSGETLIFSNSLVADFNTDLGTIIKGSLEIEGLALENAYVALRRDSGSYVNNIQFIADYFQQDKVSKPIPEKSKVFDLNIKQISLQNVQFLKDDKVKGQEMSAYVQTGNIILNQLSLPNKLLDIKDIDLESPIFHVTDFEGHPLPPLPIDPEDIVIKENQDSVWVDTLSWVVKVENFQLSDGKFELHNYRNKPVDDTPEDVLDYAHLDVFDIYIDLEEFTYSDWDFQGTIDRVALKESTGFVLNELSADTAHISDKILEFYGLSLITPQTNLGDTLIFKYSKFPDFKDFPNKVRMDLRFEEGSRVLLDDIMVFAPNLERNIFFIKNRDRLLDIEGKINGKVSNLRGKDLDIRLDDGTVFRGNFGSRNLNVRNEELINLELEQLTTSMQKLRDLIPNFNPPPNFYKLGQLNFNGRFDGYFADFVAYGNMQTDLGSAELDMRLDLKEGRQVAKYSGILALNNFDLAAWSGNPDFGQVTFKSEVKNGIGLTAATASAKLIANIEHFPFRGYSYENAILNGALNKNLFDGDFLIKDDNIDFTFEGSIDLTDSIPELDFEASVNRLALQPLNLAKQDYILGGNIDLNLKDIDISNLEGQVRVSDFSILHNQTDQYQIDTISVTSIFDTNGQRVFSVNSDVLDSKFVGDFDIEKIPETFIQYFNNNYPEFAQRFGIQSKADSLNNSKFTYELELKNSKGLNRLLDPKLDSLQGVTLQGAFDGQMNEFDLKLYAPEFRYAGLYLGDIAFNTDAEADYANLNLAVTDIVINDKQKFSVVEVTNQLRRDTMDFSLFHTGKEGEFLKKLDLNGQFFLTEDSLFQVSFDSKTNSNIELGGDNWDIKKRNFIRFGKGKVETRNFELTDGLRQVVIESVGEKGLLLSLNEFNFDFINEVWVFPKLDFRGEFDARIRAEDIYKLSDISAIVRMDSFIVNEDYFGELELVATAPNIKGVAKADLNIRKGPMKLRLDGYYNLPNYKAATASTLANQQANFFDFRLRVKEWPVNILDYFIGNAISGTKGKFDIDTKIFGQPKRPDLDGTLRMYDTEVTMDYLNLALFIPDGTAKITSTLIDATGNKIYDRLGNSASVKGGISFDHLKNWGFAAQVTTQRFLGLDTSKGDNPIYYGTGIGYGTVKFSGTFPKPNIEADITADSGSELFIPISSTYETGEVNFIRFVDKNKPKNEEEERKGLFSELKGLEFAMDLSVTPDAKMELIFDEQAGDIIKGTGRGNIQMRVPRGGELSMYGDFEIEEGQYLFTLMNIINKPFVVERGGTIRWNGDPFNAQINLVARYNNLNTPVANLIQEYLTTAGTKAIADASKATQVDLEMTLSGDLLKPNISFDIEYPNLNGELRGYVETKMRIIRSDQNELNRQVFGLIVLGQFLPPEYSFAGDALVANTLSEFVSSQLSILVTELLSEVLTSGDVVSSVDFNIGYSSYDARNVLNGENLSSGSEVNVKNIVRFLNDKLSVTVGGNVDLNNGTQGLPNSNGATFGNDLIIEYYINQSRTLKVRAYQRYEPDFAGGREFVLGGGLSYRQEFDSFRDFWLALIKKRDKERKRKERKAKSNQEILNIDF